MGHHNYVKEIYMISCNFNVQKRHDMMNVYLIEFKLESYNYVYLILYKNNTN